MVEGENFEIFEEQRARISHTPQSQSDSSPTLGEQLKNKDYAEEEKKKEDCL